MKKRRQQPDERRKAQVEVNLLAEGEGQGRVITKTRGRGCTLPFFGGTGLFLILFEAVRTALG